MSDEYKKVYIQQLMHDLMAEIADPCCVDESKPEMIGYKIGYDHAMDKVACYVRLLKEVLEV